MISGQAVEVRVDVRGSVLATAAAAFATTVLVDDPTEFDSEGGLLQIDGKVYEFTAVVEVDDPDDSEVSNGMLTLATGLLVDLPEGEMVSLWSGAQVLDDMRIVVDTGSPEPAEVTLLAEQRKDWALLEGPLDPPISVVLSDSMDRLVDAPGLALRVDATYSYAPILRAVQDADIDQSSLLSMLEIGTLRVTEAMGITEIGTGTYQIDTPGMYQVVATAAFEANGSGGRAVQPVFPNSANAGIAVTTPGDSTIPGVVQSVQTLRLEAGDQVGMAVRQNSGGVLKRLGSANGNRTSLTILLAQP